MSDRYKGAILSSTAPIVTPQSAGGVFTLSQQTQYQGQGVWPNYGTQLTKSLRFRGGSTNAFLNRTPASTSNRRTWTWSGWVKLGSKFSDGFFPLFGADATGYPCSGIALTNFNIQFFAYTDPTYAWQKISTMVLRDPSAWYHIVAVTDTTNATAEDRARVYVNGQRVTSWSTNNNPTPSYEGYVNSSSYITKVGRIAGFDYFDGYMAEVNFVDGLALDPSAFGMTNAAGTWSPIGYSGTYGTNGFYLPFTNTTSTSTLGNDFSGNGNTFTVNNISLTPGSTYDSMTDVPTLTSTTAANYATVNPVNAFGTTTSGNLNYYTTSNYQGGYATMPVSGKMYFEVTCANPTGGGALVGFVKNATIPTGTTNFFTQTNFYGAIFSNTLNYYLNGSSDGLDHGNITDSMLQFAVDRDTGKCWVGSNNTWFDSGNPATGANPAWTISLSSGDLLFPAFCVGNSTYTISVNFGQRPLSYTPPTGFVALNTFNLPGGNIVRGNQHFDATTYTGNGTVLGASQTITNAGSFQPDFVWLKSRSNAQQHNLYDVVRGIDLGGSPTLFTDAATQETTYLGYGVSALNSNGFTVIGNGGLSNNNGFTYVGWQWKAGGTAVTNTAGSISSQVSANTTAGFSIVTYTGVGGSGTTTVGHGLGVSPSMVIIKRRNSTADWATYHTGLTSTSYYLFLNSTAGQANYGSTFISPSSSTLTIDAGSSLLNTSTGTYVAYCFAQVVGYSAFGSYVGNGVNDGPFIYTGFRPRWLFVKKSIGGTSYWQCLDTSRSPYNLAGEDLIFDLPDAEKTIAQGFNHADILSNGFKIRNTNCNDSGATYIFGAFAENPFKYANAR